MQTRLATSSDFKSILDMSEEFWQHTQFDESFDRDHTEIMVQMSCDQGLLLVAEDCGIIGFISAIKAPLLGSPEALAATELAWWVAPHKRSTGLGLNLIQHLERLCVEQRVKYLNMAFMETSMPQQVKKLYLSLGYSLQETVFTKVLQWPQSQQA